MKLLLPLLLLTSSFAYSQTTSFFSINRTSIASSGTGVPSVIEDTILDSIETQANDELSNIEPGDYLKFSADSTIVSGKSTGSDYANNFSYFIIGAGLGLGVNLGPNSLSDLLSGDTEADDANGAGLQTSLMAGFNLGGILPEKLSWGKDKWWGSDRFSVFFNFFSYEIEQDELTADALSIGMKIRWLAIKPKSIVGFNLLKWEGLHVHTGFEKSSLKIAATDTLNVTETDSGFTGSYTSTVTASVEVDTFSIPLEISSAVRFLYLFTLYGGVGFDLNAGDASGNGNAPGTITVSDGGSNSETYEVQASLGQEQEPESMFQRYFAGLQFNIWKGKLYFQYDRVIGENTHGVGLGFRVSI